QTELVTQAAAGHLFANGREGDPPIPCGAGLAAGAGALGAALVVLASALGRRGDHPVDMIRVSQVNMLRTFLTTLVPHYLLTGQDPPRIGNRHALTAPWNSYPALDGWVVMATMGERQWLRAAELLGRPLL